MGLTDQFAGQVTASFPHPAEKVWAVVSDLDRMGEWSPECYRIEWLPPATGPAAGASFTGHNRMGPIRWQTTCEIEDWQQGSRFSYLARHITGAVTRWSFELDPRNGATKVVQRFETVGSPWFMMIGDRIAQRPRVLRRGMQRTLEGIGAALEDHPVDP